MPDAIEQAVNDLQRAWRIEHHVAVHLLRLMGHVGGRATSGGRSRAENDRVGGVSDSDHLWGGAVDVVASRERWSRTVDFLLNDRCAPACPGPRAVLDEGDHIHYSARRLI